MSYYVAQKDLLAAVIIAAGFEDGDPQTLKAGSLDDAICFLMDGGNLDADHHHLSPAFAAAQRMARAYLNGEGSQDNDEKEGY